jgi:hypothetical protein
MFINRSAQQQSARLIHDTSVVVQDTITVNRERLQAILDSISKCTSALAHAENHATAAMYAFADRISI